jgi:transposase
VSSRQSYSREFKDAILTKVMNRGDSSIGQICDEAGLNRSSVANWIQSRGRSMGMTRKNSKSWSAEEKFKAVSATQGLSEVELGEYLRKEGLHSHELSEWRTEMIESLTVKRKNASKKDERDVKIKNLERDLRRKDRALAEVSALLILQKKVNLLWGNNGEDDE